MRSDYAERSGYLHHGIYGNVSLVVEGKFVLFVFCGHCNSAENTGCQFRMWLKGRLFNYPINI